jgi:uncharacterized protein
MLSPEDEETWRRALLRFRTDKDDYLRDDPDSPILPEEREGFKGLKYFDPDPSFRFDVPLQRNPNPDTLIFATSKGTRQLFNRVGRFDLSVGSAQVRLEAYQSAEREDPSLFVPFRDATSGKETYGAARYLDFHVTHDDTYAVDFNYAYNPYCAYNDGYVCPLPPKENWLTIPVKAGELKYHE